MAQLLSWMEDYIFMQESLAGSLDESVKEGQGSKGCVFVRSTTSVPFAWRCDISASAPGPADTTVPQEFPDGRSFQKKNATTNQHLQPNFHVQPEQLEAWTKDFSFPVATELGAEKQILQEQAGQSGLFWCFTVSHISGSQSTGVEVLL